MSDNKNSEIRRELLKETVEDLEDEGKKGAPLNMILQVMVHKEDFDEEDIIDDLYDLTRTVYALYEPVKDEYAVIPENSIIINQ